VRKLFNDGTAPGRVGGTTNAKQARDAKLMPISNKTQPRFTILALFR
jgi:hypothetical protein